MLTIIGNKLNQAILEVSGITLDFNDAMIVEQYKEVLATNNSLTVADISLLTFQDSDTEALRIRDGADYSMVWTAGELAGVDFSAEDAKNKFSIELSSNNILAGETVDITVRLFQSDGVTPKTNVNAEFRLPFNGPRGAASVKMAFVSGVAEKTVTIKNEGIYVLGIKRVENFVITGDIPVLEVDL